MKRMVRVILAHFCSLLLATPVGWCCWLPTVRASEKEPLPVCGFCVKPEKPAPTKTPPDAPTAPSCCCDPQPAAILSPADDSSKPPIDVLPAERAVARLERRPACTALTTVVPFLNDPLPPLRVLHCVWLC